MENNTNRIEEFGFVVGGSLYLRTKPSTNADVLKVIHNGTKVQILSGKSTAFYKVLCDGVEGYCMKKYIKKGA